MRACNYGSTAASSDYLKAIYGPHIYEGSVKGLPDLA